MASPLKLLLPELKRSSQQPAEKFPDTGFISLDQWTKPEESLLGMLWFLKMSLRGSGGKVLVV